MSTTDAQAPPRGSCWMNDPRAQSEFGHVQGRFRHPSRPAGRTRVGPPTPRSYSPSTTRIHHPPHQAEHDAWAELWVPDLPGTSSRVPLTCGCTRTRSSAPAAAVSMAVNADATSALVVRLSLTLRPPTCASDRRRIPSAPRDIRSWRLLYSLEDGYKTFSKRGQLGDQAPSGANTSRTSSATG